MSSLNTNTVLSACHVGRVGALAGALGIGILIALSSPTATAETSAAGDDTQVKTVDRGPRVPSATDRAARKTTRMIAAVPTSAVVKPSAAATVPKLTPGTPDVFAPNNYTGKLYGGARIGNVGAGALTFSAPTSTSGGGAVTINPATGAFSYTPTRGQRQTAGLNTTDTFTITATAVNGSTTTQQLVTVAVDPGTPLANTPWVRTPNRATGVVTGIAKFVDPSGRTLTYTVGGASSGVVTINSTTGDFVYTPNASVRPTGTAPANTYRWQFIEQNMGAGSGWTYTNAQLGGIFDGRYSQSQVFDVGRSPGCATGGSCTVFSFSGAYLAPWQGNGTRLSWSEGDYVQLLRTDEILHWPYRTAGNGWGITLYGKPNVALVQYSSNGTQKQVVSGSGYVQSIGDGILYIGDPTDGSGNSGVGYFISNSQGINPATQGSYTFTPTAMYPTLSQLYSYKASTIPLAAGQTPKPTTDTFVITASNGARTATQTVTVQIG